MRSLVVVTVLAACGPGIYQLDTPTRFDACYAADCPMAVGSTVYLEAALESDDQERVRVQAVSVEPPALAAIELHDDYFLVRPASVGTGMLRATLHDGRLMQRRLRIADVASTTIVVEDVPGGVADFAVLAGSTLHVFADPSIVTATVHGRSISLEGAHAVGETEVTVHFDGAVLHFTLVVSR